MPQGGRTKGLGTVLNQQHAVFFRERTDLCHVDGLTKEMNWHNGAGFFCNGRFNRIRIDIKCLRVNIDKNRLRTHVFNRFSRSDKGESRCNDFITLTNTRSQ